MSLLIPEVKRNAHEVQVGSLTTNAVCSTNEKSDEFGSILVIDSVSSGYAVRNPTSANAENAQTVDKTLFETDTT